jgi:hypothetical protein
VIDQNHDLIGYEFETEAGKYRVLRSTSWSPAYVVVERIASGIETVRVAAQIRQAKG